MIREKMNGRDRDPAFNQENVKAGSREMRRIGLVR